MRYRTLTVAAVLAALLGTAGPAVAHGDWDYARHHEQWHQRHDRHHHGWNHHAYWRPRYFRYDRGYPNAWYRPYYDADPGCHSGSSWNGYGGWGSGW